MVDKEKPYKVDEDLEKQRQREEADAQRPLIPAGPPEEADGGTEFPAESDSSGLNDPEREAEGVEKEDAEEG